VIDLGTDTINVYHYNETTGVVQLNRDRIKTQPGAGPRHLLFHPDKPLAFVSNELDSTTNVYRIDAAIGTFEHQQTINTRRPEDEKSERGKIACLFFDIRSISILDSTKENTPAELHFSPDQKYLLVSNRGDENIVIYHLNDTNDQVLSVKEHLNIQGAGPRYFTFDPTGNFLLVANQNSNNLICFSYNKTNGTFQFLSQLTNIESPQHILFLS
jgi:6-phosphogluconolactonase